MSITLAADALCLSQSALSRQIITLEDALGRRLFVREHRSLRFTPDGERLFRVADDALARLQAVYGAIADPASRRPTVTISASVGLSSLWLLPRLGRFQARHPGIDLQVSADNRVLDLDRQDVDVALRYQPATARVPGAIPLFAERIMPVAAPALAGIALDDPAQLGTATLIEFDDPPRPWLRWSAWLAGDPPRPKAWLRFNHYDQLVQAAVAGQGLALGRLALIRPLLDDGRLRPLLPASRALQTDHAYWLLRRGSTPDAARQPALDSVCDWLIDEAASHD